MTRFQCGHCGERIAVASRHLGRLCRCPECGGATHPLARQLDADRRKCENCGDRIGRLQSPRQWRGNQVCNRCHEALTAEAAPRLLASASRPAATCSAPAQPVVVLRAQPLGVGAHSPATSEMAIDLSAGTLGIVVGFALMAAAFMVAMTLLSYIGLLVAVLLFLLLGVLGLQRLWRGGMMLWSRVMELRAVRAEQGAARMAVAMAAPLRSRRPGQIVLGILAILLCTAIYLISAACGPRQRAARTGSLLATAPGFGPSSAKSLSVD